jgi:hypothetical protein
MVGPVMLGGRVAARVVFLRLTGSDFMLFEVFFDDPTS